MDLSATNTMSRLPLLLIVMKVIVCCWGDYSPFRDKINLGPAAKNILDNMAAVSKVKRGGSSEEDEFCTCPVIDALRRLELSISEETCSRCVRMDHRPCHEDKQDLSATNTMSRLPLLLIVMTVIVCCWGDYSPFRDKINLGSAAKNILDDMAAVSKVKRGGSSESSESSDEDDEFRTCPVLDALRRLELSISEETDM
nr:hypothetical protein BaRGS_027028 [Batillaria attramentaria]